jgi:flagellar biosynthetic protein FliS
MTNPRTAYRENDIRGATAIRLVVLLYDQLIQDLIQAVRAIEVNEIELRTRMLNHAILVIAHLQSPLNFAKGGKVAKDLDHFYNVLRDNLVRVQFYPSKQVIRQQITDVQVLREACIEVDRVEKPAIAISARTVPSHESDSDVAPARAKWEG